MPQGYQFPRRVENVGAVGHFRPVGLAGTRKSSGLVWSRATQARSNVSRTQADMDNIAANLEKQFQDSKAGMV